MLVAFQAKFRLLAAGVADGINGRQNLRGSFRIHTLDRAREVGRVEIHRVTWTRDQIWRGVSPGTVEPSRCETKTESQGFHVVWNHAFQATLCSPATVAAVATMRDAPVTV